MRAFIAFAALAACVYAGISKKLLLKKRAKFLSETVAMLRSFSAEIKLRSPTLDELISQENGQFAKSVKAANSPDIISAWESACLALPQNNEETRLLAEFGKTFAGCGADSAQSVIEVYLERFSLLEKAACEAYSKKGAAFAEIGALSGIALAIIII